MQELTEVTEAMPMMAQHTMVVVTDLDIFRLDEHQRTALMALLAGLSGVLHAGAGIRSAAL